MALFLHYMKYEYYLSHFAKHTYMAICFNFVLLARTIKRKIEIKKITGEDDVLCTVAQVVIRYKISELLANV